MKLSSAIKNPFVRALLYLLPLPLAVFAAVPHRDAFLGGWLLPAGLVSVWIPSRPFPLTVVLVISAYAVYIIFLILFLNVEEASGFVITSIVYLIVLSLSVIGWRITFVQQGLNMTDGEMTLPRRSP
jgi:hypothetical protein